MFSLQYVLKYDVKLGKQTITFNVLLHYMTFDSMIHVA